MLESGGTLETQAVAAGLRVLNMVEFYGRIAFDSNGQALTHGLLVLQHSRQPNNGSSAEVQTIVYPPAEVLFLRGRAPG